MEQQNTFFAWDDHYAIKADEQGYAKAVMGDFLSPMQPFEPLGASGKDCHCNVCELLRVQREEYSRGLDRVQSEGGPFTEPVRQFPQAPPMIARVLQKRYRRYLPSTDLTFKFQ